MPIVHPRRRWCLRLPGGPLTWAHVGDSPGSASGAPCVAAAARPPMGLARDGQTVTTPPVMLKVVTGPVRGWWCATVRSLLSWTPPSRRGLEG